MFTDEKRIITIGFRKFTHHSSESSGFLPDVLNRIQACLSIYAFERYLGEKPDVVTVTGWTDYETANAKFKDMEDFPFAVTDIFGVTTFKIFAIEDRDTGVLYTQVRSITKTEIDGVRYVCQDEPCRPASPVWKRA